MMKHISVAMGLLLAGLSSSAHADVYAGYKGVPFNPAVGGGPNIPPGVKAGPYSIPGRLDLMNYDMGGSGVGYQTLDHFAYGGAGYRVDGPAPTFTGGQTTTLCKTSLAEKDVWYATGDATLDGTTFPSATTNDFYIGALHPNEYLNVTVNVLQSGTYSLSSTWSTGSGPMQLQIYVNGATTAAVDWKSSLAVADYHHWKPYPNFATIQLTAGVQVLKFELQSYHLNLDYVQFDLLGADGGVISGGSGSSSSGTSSTSGTSTSGASSTSGTAAASGTSPASGSSSTSGTVAGTSGSASVSGTTSASGVASSGGVGSGSTATTSGSNAGSGAVGSGTTSASGSTTSTSGTAPGGGSGNPGSTAGTTGGNPGAASTGGSQGCSMGMAAGGGAAGIAWLLGLAAMIFARSRRDRT
jgi:hypothetical protein